MSGVINILARRELPEPTTLLALPDELRLQVASAMIGFGLNPSEYLDWEVDEVMDTIAEAADELHERLAGTPGLFLD
jgi:hypothetical protein